jgi:NADPH:quinone reductase-like Zn-dependent oxidoreductase
MKAAVRSKYGPPEVISIQDVAKPIPADDGILIKVHATTVNRTDCGILSGKPLLIRLFTGIPKPRPPVTGSDFAGEVEAIGKNVRAFKVGDRVMGLNGVKGSGSHAEYLTLSGTRRIVTIPSNITFEQAAACMEGAFYAASCINLLKPQSGQKALVYGATGAIGSAMVQILKYYGLYVTAVCRGQHLDIVRSLGANKVFDYTTEDFTSDVVKYDFVFDAVGKTSFAKSKHLLKPKGIYTATDGFENLFLALSTGLFGKKKVVFNLPKNLHQNLVFLRDLAEQGHFKPLIDRKYPLEQVAEAYRYVATEQKVGNVILTIRSPDSGM